MSEFTVIFEWENDDTQAYITINAGLEHIIAQDVADVANERHFFRLNEPNDER